MLLVLIKCLKAAHWVWTVVTLSIAGFWFIHHGGTNWFPVSVSVVSSAIAETNSKGAQVLASSEIVAGIHSDAINIAAQLGRMDMAALAMTIISVVFALLGIFGFMHLKDRAEFIAKKTTEECFDKHKKEMTSTLEKNAVSYMEGVVPDLVSDYVELSQSGIKAENEDMSDDIAPAPDEEISRGGL
ncbi:hypothetical protein ACUM5Y_01675 [Marinomonas dokdonensis]|uniref:hypothetical protein n=1 Tax=Marinomonas dokdonensis TaxID=328224 RepID=UPI0040553C4E